MHPKILLDTEFLSAETARKLLRPSPMRASKVIYEENFQFEPFVTFFASIFLLIRMPAPKMGIPLMFGVELGFTRRTGEKFHVSMTDQMALQVFLGGCAEVAQFALEWFVYGVIGARNFAFVVHFTVLSIVFSIFVFCTSFAVVISDRLRWNGASFIVDISVEIQDANFLAAAHNPGAVCVFNIVSFLSEEQSHFSSSVKVATCFYSKERTQNKL